MSSSQVRDELMGRLQQQAKLSPISIEWIKTSIVAGDHSTLPDRREISQPGKYYRQDGREHTFYDVPLAKVVKEVESSIERTVPEERQTAVYHAVLRGVQGHKEVPVWDDPSPNPFEKPLTPFSAPVRHLPFLPPCLL